MGLRYSNQRSGSYFFVTTTFSNWERLGDVPGFYETLAENLIFYCRKYHAGVIAFVFMPTHIHFILNVEGSDLSNLMRDFKKYVAQHASKKLGVTARAIWMPRFDRVEIVSETIMRTKVEYIHQNPVKAGIVRDDSDWKWSSASSYAGNLDCVIEIDKDWA